MPEVSSFEYSPRSRITFNVSGTKFETWSDTIERFPSTLLGNRERLEAHYCATTHEYFFDRNRFAFESVLYFFQSNGRLIRPPEVSLEVFATECNYYAIPIDCIERLRVKEGQLLHSKDLDVPLSQPVNIREWIWYMTERPDLSQHAFAYNVCSLGAIVVWVTALCAQTLPFENLNLYVAWLYVDIVFSSVFTLEYVLRFATTPNRRKFVFQAMNIIDFASSIPYLLILIVSKNTELPALNFLRLLRLLRVVRFLKLGNSSNRVKLLQKIMASSLDDLGLLFLCLLMVVLIGASLLFFTEVEVEGTQFTSVPASAWWAIQTVVVLGYGDIIPKSDAGKLLASFFMIFGALTISLPVLSVVTKLVKVYGKELS
eukprot:gene11751-12971_t